MLVVVPIAYVDSSSAVKEISREEDTFSLIPSSTCIVVVMRDEIDLRFYLIIMTRECG
jgi:hypothetical protein